ncbi:hypothetical protein [Streptomyces sp. ICBB 8177]|uniref:PH-like domain-containing protein n=1 Tax=Streptomyces sp. ICBB 8177 TaxID=563922 RepID=UPI000D6754D2|nr:hypothetical protein [Streptomyces sp. ICBB 8177]PWI42107.1 hypothetical protein CK485_25440 [Streptomyces sp. ICBB 8177]
MNATTLLLAEAKHSARITDLSGRLEWLAVFVVLIALVYWLMWRAWRKRAARQSDLPELPAIPADPGTPLAHPSPTAALNGGGEPPRLIMSGRYHASTTAGDWLDRIAARGLGTRSLVDLTLTEQGVVVRRPAATDFFIPAAALRGARLDKGIAGKVVPEGGLLVITWSHGDRVIDSGFRSEHPAEHPAWVEAVNNLNTTREGAR